jgi:hypothetical protein
MNLVYQPSKAATPHRCFQRMAAGVGRLFLSFNHRSAGRRTTHEQLLWQPSESQIQSSNMYRFMTLINQRYGTSFDNYDGLYQWSVDHIPEFWKEMWDFAAIKASVPYDQGDR